MENEEGGKSIAGLLRAVLFVCFLGAIAYALYFFGTEKDHMQKTVEAIEHINEKMRENFSGSGIYPSADVIKTYHITPKNMQVADAQEYFWRHYFGGNMLITGVFDKHDKFAVPEYNVILNNLSRRHCIMLASYDWRGNENFLGLQAYGFGILAMGSSASILSRTKLITEEEAKKACSCEYGSYCSIILVYK